MSAGRPRGGLPSCARRWVQAGARRAAAAPLVATQAPAPARWPRPGVARARLPDATPNHWAQRLAVAHGFAVTCRRSPGGRGCRRREVFPPGGTGPLPTCSASAISAGSCRRPALRPPLRAATARRSSPDAASGCARRGHRAGPRRRRPTPASSPSGATRPLPAGAAAPDRRRRWAATPPNAFGCAPATLGVLPPLAPAHARRRGHVPQDHRHFGIRTAAVRPRVHDLRHSLPSDPGPVAATKLNIDERIGTVHYLGHVAPADTYWYQPHQSWPPPSGRRTGDAPVTALTPNPCRPISPTG